MSILFLSTIRTLVRSSLNETSSTPITDTELNAIANDGYVNVAVKGLCYEEKISISNIPDNIDLIPLSGYNIVRVNYIEYATNTPPTGMICVNPQAIGHITIDTYYPQFWFQWGNYIKIEPLPDLSTYDLNLYTANYPSIAMVSDTDTPLFLPPEFHECVYLYTLAFSCFKLRRWDDAINNYNRYSESIQLKRMEYVSKFPEVRSIMDLPKNVKSV
jgi:hypothetical protein